MSLVEDINNMDIDALLESPHYVKAAIFFAVIIIACSIAFFMLIQPQIQKLDTLQRQATSLKKDFEWKQGVAANKTAYEEQIKEVDQSIKSLSTLLPKFQNKEEIIISLTNSALRHDLIGQTIQPLDETIKTYYAELPYNIEVEGGFHGIGRFVADIASLKRIVTLHDFVIQKKGDSDTLHFTLKAKTYRLIDNAAGVAK